MYNYFAKRPRASASPSIDSASVSASVKQELDDSYMKSFDVDDIEDGEIKIESDPSLRKPIDSYDMNIRDRVRREYVAKGPCQPRGHDFPKKEFGTVSRTDMRSFRYDWFKDRYWLEYSVSKDVVYCFWYFLFKCGFMASGNEAFTSTGISNWKKGT